MSAINMHPAQTYSRLFRPWDNMSASSSSSANHCNNEQPINRVMVKTECRSPEVANIKTERSVYTTSNDSDRECVSNSSSSCSKSSYEDGLNNSLMSSHAPAMHSLPMHLPGSPGSPMAHMHANSNAFTTPRLYGTLEQQMHMMAAGMPPSNEQLYYAAAAAAAVNGMAAPPNASAFGMDPYSYGLMEQEYARVMAEDAQLKAINARKQRPKKFKCPHCDVAFSNNGQLKGHIRIHTGERPFKCDVETCGKTFTRNEELTRHKRIHTGLRPYPCSACGKKFGRRDHLKKHMKTHMPQERQLGPAILVPMYPYLYGY